MKKFKIASKLIIVFFFASCAFILLNCSTSIKMEKDLFDKNVAACAQVFIKQNGMDSVMAAHYCSCVIEKLIKIDSNFVYMKEEERTKFINETKYVAADCDSILLDHEHN